MPRAQLEYGGLCKLSTRFAPHGVARDVPHLGPSLTTWESFQSIRESIDTRRYRIVG